MKTNETPMKIYLNPDAVPHNQSGKFLFIHNSDIDESKCTVEYVRKDAFIEKMGNFLSEKYLIKTKEPLRWVSVRQIVEDFKKYMKGE